jgi:A/G-specific adenine glycosylase
MQKTFPHGKLGRKISHWYLLHGRHELPWRNNISAYRVWISEIMLQQTQVITVVPFFKRFMQRFPNLKSFLSASEEEILALWSGLGYYRRARNIFQAKEIIKNLHNGRFPKNFDEILSLPGIGRSTAGAIASIAYGQPFPILDTNVKRVLFRVHALTGNEKEKELWNLATAIQDGKDSFSYTQGVMDLGASICLREEPKCKDCPLNKDCLSAFKASQAMPIKKLNKKKLMNMQFYLFMDQENFLAQKNNDLSIWSGLWLLPTEIPKNFVNNFRKLSAKNIQHQLSHRTLNITFTICKMKSLLKPETTHEYKTVKIKEFTNLGMPKPITELIQNL